MQKKSLGITCPKHPSWDLCDTIVLTHNFRIHDPRSEIDRNICTQSFESWSIFFNPCKLINMLQTFHYNGDVM